MKDERLEKTFKLWKDFSFEAAHQLTKVPSGHKCGRMHGHHYKVRIHCEGKLNPDRDWIVDYAEVNRVTSPWIDKLDHGILNHHMPPELETTAENLAWWLAQVIKPELPELSGVEVFETPTTSVLFKL